MGRAATKLRDGTGSRRLGTSGIVGRNVRKLWDGTGLRCISTQGDVVIGPLNAITSCGGLDLSAIKIRLKQCGLDSTDMEIVGG